MVSLRGLPDCESTEVAEVDGDGERSCRGGRGGGLAMAAFFAVSDNDARDLGSTSH